MNSEKFIFMKEGGEILAQILLELEARIEPELPTKVIDDWTRRLCLKYGVKPSFLGYRDYPSSICVSLNDEVVHGIPNKTRLKIGDLVSLDLGIYYKGYHTDSAITFGLGEISEKQKKLIEVTKSALDIGINQAVLGKRIGDIGYVIQNFVEAKGFNVVRALVGHSIGLSIHEDPLIPNFGLKNEGPKIREGMTLAIEPMITEGGHDVYQDDDGWTYKTSDGSLATHFEHTIYVTRDKPVILTQSKETNLVRNAV